MTLTVGSLFSGIGGLDLGFERAGFDIRWQVEIDPYCRRVLAKHWPAVARYEDVREVGAHNLEWVDVIVGGFPCQDISTAGKGAGLAGSRSGLWFEFYRTICELRPRYVVVENVPALLHRGLDRILGGLAEAGYDAEWQMLPAAAFGAPHLRWRIFICAWNVADPDSKHGTYEQATQHKKARIYTNPIHRARSTPRWTIEPPVGRVANGVPRRVDRLRGLGNAVVPQVAEYVARCVMQHAEAQGAA